MPTTDLHLKLLVVIVSRFEKESPRMNDTNLQITWLKLSILFFFTFNPTVNARILLMIEGNTGAGKTTLSRLIERELNAHIIAEPIDKWRKVGDTGNLLDLHLNHRNRWGYTFQSYACLTFMQACLEADQTKEIHVSDRSAYSGIYCFSRMMMEEGSLTPLEWYIYKERFEWLTDLLPCKSDGFIYLRTTPANCLARANARHRPEESALTMDFFEPLHRFHEEWLIDKKNVASNLVDIPVLVLDGNLDFKSDPIIQQQFVDQIRNFIEEVNTYKHTHINQNVEQIPFGTDMIDHTSIAVKDYPKSLIFYDATLDCLGYERIFTIDENEVQTAGYGANGKPSFWISPLGKADEEIGKARGVHFAFLAHSKEEVDTWYTKCLELGGKDNGKPGPRPEYHPGYYGAFIIDPNGWRIEACVHDAL